MTVVVTMLRGVNVGGHQKLTNPTLTDVCERAGFSAVRTYLQSGNVVVRASERSAARVAAKIESGLREVAGLSVDVLVRTTAEMRAVVQNNPLATAGRLPNRLHVVFLGGVPAPAAVGALQDVCAGGEEIALRGRELYAYFPEGMGRSKLASSFTERKLGVACTARNWNTVTALCELAEEMETVK